MSRFNEYTGTHTKWEKTPTESWTFFFRKLPETLEDMKAMSDCDLKQPQNTAAMVLLALCVYPKDKEECFRMLEYLSGPKGLSEFEKQFLADRFADGQDYIPFSYFEGATPDNDYTPHKDPYKLVINELPQSKQNLSVGYYSLYFTSSGADSLRYVTLKKKASTGEWFLNEQFLMVQIKDPRSKDPWA